MDILNNTFISSHFAATSHDPHGLLLAYEEGLCKRIFEKLWEHYPMYDWKVKVDASPKMGMVSIKLPRIHHSALGYNFPVDKLANDPGMGIVVKAGGELLERFKLTRGKANKAEYTDQIRSKRVFRLRDHIDGGLAVENKARWVHGGNTIVRVNAA
jgi:hypothetical protein